MRVLVATSQTADDRKTIAAVRALGTAGADVVVGADRRFPAPRLSRFCNGGVLYPDPATDLASFETRLLELLAEGQFDVLLPLCDYTTVGATRRKAELKCLTSVAVPDDEVRALAQDKLEIGRIAARLGIGVPATWLINSKEAAQGIVRHIEFPCVVKLRRGAGGAGLRFPASPAELLECIETLFPFSDPVFDGTALLVQEYIPGETHDVCALFCEGEPRAVLTQKRLRMHPSTGGIGINNVTTDEPELKALAIALLRELRWHGPAQVEFRRDAGGTAKLIEVNPRFWGTLDLAIQAGVNFPLLACRMAIDGDVEPVSLYRIGLKYRWPIPFGARLVWRGPDRWAAAAHFFLPRSDAASDLRFSDPLPNLASWLGDLGASSARWLPRKAGTPFR
jgi:predicted ATP-grasp superfamily ATP-dependent carboligase